MEPLKRRWRNLSLRKTLVVYITAAALLAVVLCDITNDLCSMEIREIHAGYLDGMEKYYLTNERGERMGDGTYIGTDAFPLSPEDQRTVDILRALPRVTTPAWSALCILGAALLFYRNKLKRPLTELRLASEKISQNDLDFTVTAHSRDELGQLCASFETMRAALAQNFSEMWRQMEERKRLNAAFAHDLRTPLTVLKGHNEMLQFSGDEQTRATAVTMQRHISRLEHYVDTMSQLRRLEDTQPVYRQTPLKVLVASLYESGTILCEQAGKRFSMENRITSLSLPLDGDLLLSVSDDGPGFDKNSLEKATEPYFTGEKADHFGLGLYTSKILCEHHDGWLRIENTVSGAKVTVFFKSR